MSPLCQHRTFLACTIILATSTLAWGATGDYIEGNQTDGGGNQDLLGVMTDDGKNASGSIVDGIIKDLTTGRSKVWLFAVHNKQIFTLIVGPLGRTINLDASYVFKQDLTTLDSSSYKGIKLMAPKKLKDLWPAVSGSYTKMVHISDSNSKFIIFVGEKEASTLNTDTGTTSSLSLNSKWSGSLLKDPLLASNQKLTFYYYEDGNLGQAHFIDSPPTSSPHQVSDACISSSRQDGIIITSNNLCPSPVTWIRTGFVDDQKVIIFTENNSVVIFAKSAYDAATGVVVPIKKIAASQFWNNLPDNGGHTLLFIGLILLCLLLVGLLYFLYKRYTDSSITFIDRQMYAMESNGEEKTIYCGAVKTVKSNLGTLKTVLVNPKLLLKDNNNKPSLVQVKKRPSGQIKRASGKTKRAASLKLKKRSSGKSKQSNTSRSSSQSKQKQQSVVMVNNSRRQSSRKTTKRRSIVSKKVRG